MYERTNVAPPGIATIRITSVNAEEEFLERLRCPGAQRFNDAAKGDLDGKSLRSRDGHQLELIWKSARPIGNEMVLREADIGVTPRDHLRDIPMSDAEATGKVLDLVGKEGVGGRLSDQPFDGGPVAGVRACLDQVSLRDAGAGTCHVGKATNLERIALADKQSAAAIPREVAGPRLENSELVQFPQRSRPTHDDIGVETRRTGEVDREIAERDCARTDDLDDHRLRQSHDHDVVQVEIRILRLCLGPIRERADDLLTEKDHQVIALGEDHEARWCPDPTDDVYDGVGVTVER
jgi:hypothetical protein